MCSDLTLGERLADLRSAHKLTQRALAKELGLGASTIAGYESGKHLPPLDVLLKLKRFYNVSLDYLVGETDYSLRVKDMDHSYVVFDSKRITTGKLIEVLLSLDEHSRLDLYSTIDALIRGGRLKLVSTGKDGSK